MDDEPEITLGDPAELLAGYLDFYRSEVLRKIDGLGEAELRSSRVPSGWTPIGLVNHLAHMERRWLRWGFRAEQVDSPWGDSGNWTPERPTAEVLAFFHEQCAHSREIAASAELTEVARAGGRFSEDDRPTLGWILFHVLQEYARHAGHLDISRELTDGSTG
ncbi:DinB family protein [Allokutzneria multivorans]|uniref:DinB family protein n=1 Tax=Allokutzneria multivorans TaxID=1142134 RepID=A0ABP7U1G4_9PSEU